MSGTFSPEDQAKAASLLQKGCNMGDGDGCYLLADMRRANLGTNSDPALVSDLLNHATECYRAACSGGDARSCAALGLMFIRGEAKSGNVAQGLQWMERACELGDGTSCMMAARRHRKGHMVPINNAAAARFHRMACEVHLSPADCCAAGVMLLQGQGAAADREEAQKLFEQACEGGETHGCMAAWSGSGAAPKTLRNAAELFVGACAPTYPPPGCDGQCSSDSKPGNSPGVERARESLEELCSKGEPRACYAVGLMYAHAIGAEGDLAKSAALMTKACAAGLAAACSDLANRYALGIGVARDAKASTELHRKACAAGSRFSCRALLQQP